MALQRIKLPFNLYCDLKITQYLGDSPAHKTGHALDFAPLISQVSYPHAVALYTATYLQLFSHMKYGLIRINESKTCWHYHFYGGRERYTGGVEHYCLQDGDCKRCGDEENINATKYGFLGKISARVGQVQDFLLDQTPFIGVFTPTFWSHLVSHFKLKELPETYVYYDTDMISASQIGSVMSPFSVSVQWTAANALLPISPQGKSEFFGAGAGIALLGLAAILLLDSQPSPQSQGYHRKG